MNIFKQIKIAILGVLLFMGFCQFTVFQTDEKDLIIGTWAPEGSPNSKKIFEAGGICKDYYKGNLVRTFTWTIPEEGVLQLVENKTKDIYKYELSFYPDTKTMELIWFVLPSKRLLYFRN
ncbi:hypothetical protein [Flavobacterium faecale]|uniref:hypothetical protein n=1 Tax=Flavobacterium faecale TaxID=1355330 RepID=UPI003AB05953